MREIQVHIFYIIKLLFILTFLVSASVLKLQLDILAGLRFEMSMYNFREMIEYLVYSILMLLGGSTALIRFT